MQRLIYRLKCSPLYEIMLPFFLRSELRSWYKRDKKLPVPHLVKQSHVKQQAATYGIKTFVETGTYLGTMIAATKYTFDRMYSIEIDHTLYQRARKKFANDDHITILKGDSMHILPKLVKKLKEPTIFWLDAHYSKGMTGKGRTDTPIIHEIQHILHHSRIGHVILIDDASLFSARVKDYPSLKELRHVILKMNPKLKLFVRDNIIFIH